jgi:hypothetical protein
MRLRVLALWMMIAGCDETPASSVDGAADLSADLSGSLFDLSSSTDLKCPVSCPVGSVSVSWYNNFGGGCGCEPNPCAEAGALSCGCGQSACLGHQVACCSVVDETLYCVPCG